MGKKKEGKEKNPRAERSVGIYGACELTISVNQYGQIAFDFNKENDNISGLILCI